MIYLVIQDTCVGVCDGYRVLMACSDEATAIQEAKKLKAKVLVFLPNQLYYKDLTVEK